MPKINAEDLEGAFFKPSDLNLKIGDRKTFRIVGPHVESKSKDGKQTLLSVPVEMDKRKKSFNLNLTTRKQLVMKLGDDTDTWTGSTFECVVIPQNNPTTGQQTKGWALIEESISRPKK